LIHGGRHSNISQEYFVEEDSMRLSLKGNRWIRILLFISLSSLLLAVLVGFRDFKKEGVKCTLRARIVDIQTLPSGTQVLVVKELLTTAARTKSKERTIDVLVTSETISGTGDRILQFKDFRVGTLIEIQGLKVIEREDGQDNTVILAQEIRQLVG
jgi:hypothetical protein